MLYPALSGPLGMQTHCGPSERAAKTYNHHLMIILFLIPVPAASSCIHGLPADSVGGFPDVHAYRAMTLFGWWDRFVSLEDAERTVKTGQPPEMRMEVSATATAPQPVRAVAAPAAAAEPARPGAPLQNGPAAEQAKVHLQLARACSDRLLPQRHMKSPAFCQGIVTLLQRCSPADDGFQGWGSPAGGLTG